MKNILIILSILVSTLSVSAQKMGHINTQTILLSLPDYEQAGADLQAYAGELKAEYGQFETLYMEKEKKYLEKKAQYEADPDSYPIGLLEQDRKHLEESAQKLQELQYTIQQKGSERESALINAIVEKINKAAKEYAEENGYTYIMDAAALVYAGGDDLNEAIKTKLAGN